MSSSSAPRTNAFELLMCNRVKKETQNLPNKRKSISRPVDKCTTAGNSFRKTVDHQISDDRDKSLGFVSTETKSCQEDVIEAEKSFSEVMENKNKKRRQLLDRIGSLKSVIPLLKKKGDEFDPKSVACWGDGERVPFIFLCLAFDLISHESGRIAIRDIVCNTLRTVMDTTPQDLVAVVYLLANRIAPAHEGMELGLGKSSLYQAVADVYGTTEKQIKIRLKDRGDLGIVAQEIHSSQRSWQSRFQQPDALTIFKVLDTFRLIAKEFGSSSREKKRIHVKDLLIAATDSEPLYLIRLLQSNLQIGLAEQTLLAALGQATIYTEKHSKPPSNILSPLEEAAKIVKQAFSVLPVYDEIVDALLKGGVWNLPNTCKLSLGVPVGPMLAKPIKAVSEIWAKFQGMEFSCEYKYDGERAQIHFMENDLVEIYSRSSERMIEKYPDVVDAISRLKKSAVKSCILDCELVAFDREKKKILPFQILSTRARKNVSLRGIKVEVSIYAFDMLYLNGAPLIHEQLKVRRQRLYESFEEEPGYFQFATTTTSSDLEEIQKFLDAAVGDSCEGLIIKTLDGDATYEASKRSNNWLKLKKDYMESIGDSLDLVPIAAFHGKGKRTGVYGSFLLACYDSSNEEFQSICKLGTGFSEEILETVSLRLRSKTIDGPKAYYSYSNAITPDVWFEPAEVWEVKAADLTKSPIHRAGIGLLDGDKGISLRFPRLVRVREDKTPEQATSSKQVAEMYAAQKTNHQSNEDDDDDEAGEEGMAVILGCSSS